MKVKIKKSVLENYYKKLHEGRTDKDYDKTQSNFYGNFGSVKSSQELEDELKLIEPSPQMANQPTIDAPPVEDPQYIPHSHQDLGRAAMRISQEVPNSKIEYFYRMLHKLLDDSLELNEAIDYNNIDNPAHEKAIRSLIDQAIAMASRSPDSKN